MNTQISKSKQSMVDFNSVWLISANDLLLGHVVYLTDSLEWSPSIAQALKYTTETDAQTQLVSTEENDTFVVSPITLNASIAAGGEVVPSHFRDQFRVSGPTYQQQSASNQ